MRAEAFIREGLEFQMDVVTRAADVIPAFEQRLRLSPDKAQPHPILDKM
jgi:hypothetical protein